MRHDSIELRHLRYFVALAEALNFGRAAAKCHVSQPPFSVAIRQLEAYLGAELVVRKHQRVQLTDAGQAFRDKAVRLLAQAQDAYTQTRSVAEGKQGVLRIGFHASMVFRGLDRLVAQLAVHEPLLRVELVELSSQAQIDALLAGHIDIGFGHSAVMPSQLAFVTLFLEPLVACLPPRHPAAARAETGAALDLQALQHEAFILFRRAGSPAYFDQIVALCMQAGFTRYDSAFAGVGGCPFVPGAAGNVATEDVLHMCDEMGVKTGIDLDQAMAISRRVVQIIDHPTDSYLLRAGKSKDLIRDLPTGQIANQTMKK